MDRIKNKERAYLEYGDCMAQLQELQENKYGWTPKKARERANELIIYINSQTTEEAKNG